MKSLALFVVFGAFVSYSNGEVNETTGHGGLMCEKPGTSNAAGRSWDTSEGMWPEGKIYIMFDDFVTPEVKEKLHEGINYLQNVSCLEFHILPFTWVTNQSHVKVYQHLYGCGGHAGYPREGNGYQISHNNSDYYFTYLFMHPQCNELFHSLHVLTQVAGALPEHTRPDRDEYVTVHWQNLYPHPYYYASFLKANDPSVLHSGGINCEMNVPSILAEDGGRGCSLGQYVDIFHRNCFDFDSIMLYPPMMHSFNGLPTMSAKDPSVTIEHFGGKTLSAIDKYELNQAYKCPGYESAVQPECPWKSMRPEEAYAAKVQAIQELSQEQCLQIESENYGTAYPLYNATGVYPAGEFSWPAIKLAGAADNGNCVIEVSFCAAAFEVGQDSVDSACPTDSLEVNGVSYCGSEAPNDLEFAADVEISFKLNSQVGNTYAGFRATVCVECQEAEVELDETTEQPAEEIDMTTPEIP